MKELIIRASEAGQLMKEPAGYSITEKQLQELEELKVKYASKGLTPKQEERMQYLEEKRMQPPKLGKSAEALLKKIWLREEKQYEEEFESKYTKKGKQSEEDSITLLCEVDGILYNKNTVRLLRNGFTGEWDIYHEPLDSIDDVKSCWSPLTFMNAGLSKDYEWQLRVYMWLAGCKRARLRYCLVDCPPEVYEEEYSKFRFRNGIIDDSLPEYAEQIKQFELNHIYTTSGLYTAEERVKTFEIEHEPAKIKELIERYELACEFYKTITLNS